MFVSQVLRAAAATADAEDAAARVAELEAQLAAAVPDGRADAAADAAAAKTAELQAQLEAARRQADAADALQVFQMIQLRAYVSNQTLVSI